MSEQGVGASGADAGWSRPVGLPGPLKAALEVLEDQSCALSHLDLCDPGLLADLGESSSAESVETLRGLHAWHSILSQFPEAVRRTLLDHAHIAPWPERRRGRSTKEEAKREFHRWTNLVVLCNSCHKIFDGKVGPIPRSLVVKARTTVLGTPTGKAALEMYLARFLAYRGGRPADFPMGDEAFAMFELNKLHGGPDRRFSVTPHRLDDRCVESTVNPEVGLITVGRPGEDGFFFGYTVTDVPPPEPGMYRDGERVE
ncbi:HNH endonuclease [Kitasatospora sp. P5_F3]